ncbi:hypothetical protein ACQP2F_30680 [Actinoplanes sp. CA-030573]|uniref:hypothetical protein n=1 Tax=Actinoplanes sp. CA-030573 TaxID=3239898 RepID=UPI003D8CCD00
MSPHIHVERNLNRQAATRNMLASEFGLIADSPSSVTTGCGLRVAYAMTSARPESVTCLPCREHAARWHRAAAGLDRPLYHLEQARKFG